MDWGQARQVLLASAWQLFSARFTASWRFMRIIGACANSSCPDMPTPNRLLPANPMLIGRCRRRASPTPQPHRPGFAYMFNDPTGGCTPRPHGTAHTTNRDNKNGG